MERQNLPGFLYCRVGLGIDVLMHGVGAHRRHQKPDDTRHVLELLDDAIGHLGIVERQVGKGFQPVRARQDLFDQPPVIGERDLRLEFRLRVHAHQHHRRRQEHRHVDAHRVHALQGKLHIPVIAVRDRLFHRAKRFPGDTPADILIADTRIREAAGFARDAQRRAGQLLHYRVFDVFKQLGDGFGFVVMRIRIDDKDVLEAAFIALTRGIGQEFRGVEIVNLERIDVVT